MGSRKSSVITSEENPRCVLIFWEDKYPGRNLEWEELFQENLKKLLEMNMLRNPGGIASKYPEINSKTNLGYP